MNLISIKLQVLLGESLSPQSLVAHKFTPNDFNKWNAFLTAEIVGIKRNAFDMKGAATKKSRSEILGLINGLIKLSNNINAYQNKQLPVWRDHPQASRIKAQYVHTCTVMEDLIGALKDMYPFAKRQVRITNFSLPETKMALRQHLNLLGKYVNNPDIENDLSEILTCAVGQIINHIDLTTEMVIYITRLMDAILKTKAPETGLLQRLLIVNDFNTPVFFNYCTRKWKINLTEISGLHEQQELILKEKDWLFDVHLEKGLKMPLEAPNLYEDLNNFLCEKYLHIKEMAKIRRRVFKDSKGAMNGSRMLINLPVPQIGLFIRMQIEKGWLGKEHIGELFTFFANHFYTPNTPFMSPESLQKKSTDVEFSTAQKMKAHLISMINWLNTHYNLSNYN